MQTRNRQRIRTFDKLSAKTLRALKEQAIEKKERKDLIFLNNIFDKIENLLIDISNFTITIPYFLKHLGFLLINALSLISWLSIIPLVFGSLFRFAEAVAFSRDDQITRFMKVVIAMAGLALGIAAMTLVSLTIPLFVASAATDTFCNLWEVCAFLYDHSFGKWKNKRDALKSDKKVLFKLLTDPYHFNFFAEHRINKNEASNVVELEIIRLDNSITKQTNIHLQKYLELSKKTHLLFICSIGLVGACLLFTPFTFAGAVILIGSATYGLMDKARMNPITYLWTKYFGDPFAQRLHFAETKDVRKHLKINQIGTRTPTFSPTTQRLLMTLKRTTKIPPRHKKFVRPTLEIPKPPIIENRYYQRFFKNELGQPKDTLLSKPAYSLSSR